MSGPLTLRNRQRRWRLDVRRLEEVAAAFLAEIVPPTAQLGVHLVGATAMARLNRRWLDHEGSTDVITFDHRASPDAPLYGELFISIDDASAQAKEFGTTPEHEVVRYIVHGVLHLRGHDDQTPAARRLMKREENRWMRRLEARFPLRGWIRPARSRKG